MSETFSFTVSQSQGYYIIKCNEYWICVQGKTLYEAWERLGAQIGAMYHLQQKHPQSRIFIRKDERSR